MRRKTTKAQYRKQKYQTGKKVKEEPIQRMVNLQQNHNFGKKSPFKRTCRPKENYKRKLRKVTDTENTTIGEKFDESESRT